MNIINFLMRIVYSTKHRIHQRLDPVGYARSIGVNVGQDCRLINVEWGSEPYLISIGNHVSATKTQFITHDGGVWIFREENPEIDLFGKIKIGNNVFLGSETVVLPGVTIGDNVVIGARSVVTKNIPSNSVVVGIPGKVIKSTEEYYEGIKDRVIYTKNLNDEEKRIYLIKMVNE